MSYDGKCGLRRASKQFYLINDFSGEVSPTSIYCSYNNFSDLIACKNITFSISITSIITVTKIYIAGVKIALASPMILRPQVEDVVSVENSQKSTAVSLNQSNRTGIHRNLLLSLSDTVRLKSNKIAFTHDF